MKTRTICITGGTGFVGRHLCNRLSDAGDNVRVLTRRRERHRDLIVNPRVELRQVDVYDDRQLAAHTAGCDVLINLVGILNEDRSPNRTFVAAHVELPRRLIAAARANGISRLLHMSALNADPDETGSRYLKTKGEGEALVHEAAADGLRVTSFRPSVIFGPDDSFFNRFATLLKLSPVAFPLACPAARFAPVYVGDVTAAFARALEDDATAGKHYELCGPHTYTLREIVEYTARHIGVRRIIVNLGDGLSRAQARLLEWVPGKPFSLDNYYSLQRASVCRQSGLERLGIEPTPVNAVMPLYLGGRRVRARYARWRRQAGRR